jgi:hypothetical protein
MFYTTATPPERQNVGQNTAGNKMSLHLLNRYSLRAPQSGFLRLLEGRLAARCAGDDI